MADIFASYKREDRHRVEPLVRALEALGTSVWWDTGLLTGQSFTDAIERELKQAKHVLVLWSESSLASDWVYAEALHGYNRSKLIQVALDQHALKLLPPPFNMLHVIDFSRWSGDLGESAFQQLLVATGVKPLVSEPEKPTRDARRLRNQTAAAPSREESAAWGVAQALNTSNAYEAFLAQHREGQLATEAKRRIAAGADRKGNIFISYRRDDSAAVARLVYEHLRRLTQPEKIFFDVTSIPPGINFAERIRERLIRCSAALVLIGPNWTGSKAMGAARIRSKRDFIRIEVETAFEYGLRIIPVLTRPEHLPKAQQLPRSIRRICDVQAASLDMGKSYEQDIEVLSRAVIESAG